jgi:hypothetical protein
MKIKYYYGDPESHDFAVLRNINFEFHFRPLTAKKYDILIIYIIIVYRDARPQDLNSIVYLRTFAAKSISIHTASIRNSQIKKQKQRNESTIKRSRGRLKGAKNARNI